MSWSADRIAATLSTTIVSKQTGTRASLITMEQASGHPSTAAKNRDA
jgi:hypothetical protein